MKPTNGQLSMFDFVFDEPPKVIITPPPKTVEPIKPKAETNGKNNLCPYPIPTVNEIIKQIERSAYSVNKSKLISDVFECGAIAISNAVDFNKSAEREERYKQVMKTYKPQERELLADIFGKIFALLSSVVYDNGVFNDYLGDLFMRCEQGEKRAGQFFTPYHVSRCMAEMTITDDKIKQGEIITINDCCCGGGGMLIAALDVLKNRYGVNYARDCFIDAGDIDERCVHMTYLQLSLAGVPSIIKHQDALTRELWGVWKTPAYVFQYTRFCKYENLN
jgi:type I restriction-modification system DNA methylase subunit